MLPRCVKSHVFFIKPHRGSDRASQPVNHQVVQYLILSEHLGQVPVWLTYVASVAEGRKLFNNVGSQAEGGGCQPDPDCVWSS